ncbi:hypothetical protein ATO12_12675 [Aquimarina atlantica]|uniref:HTH luxR-type domain-containing protein n=1 Tax=Aquimarina atlantica TaxID=1317122 RepID=A0A023BXF1_9FLAO|nr:LuxR C-terminal-related transcriptional regulator [Aquimarina atlantica]EZH74614.1 hypothetical protein ATO12_12675 [Aquimarina atlantica]
MKLKFLILIYVLCSYPIFGQTTTKIDSLLFELNVTNDSLKGSIYSKVAWYYHSLQKTDSVEVYAKKGIEFLSHNNDTKHLASLYRVLGLSYTIKSNYKLAINSFEKAISNYKKIKGYKEVTDCIFEEGTTYFYQGSYKKSLDNYFLALDDYEKTNDYKGVTSCLFGIGGVYFNLKEFDKALSYYQKGLDVANKEDINIEHRGIAYTNIASIFLEKNEMVEAMDNYNKAKTIFDKTNNNWYLAIVHENIGRLHIKRKNYTSAVESFKSSMDYYKLVGGKSGLLFISREIAEMFKSQNKRDSTLFYTKIAYLKAKEYGMYRELYSINNDLSIIYQDKGDCELALKHLNEKGTIQDSLYGIDLKKHISELDTKYETEKKEREIALLNKDITIKQQNAQQQQLYIFLLASTAIAFVILVIFLFSRIKYRKRLHVREKKEQALLLKQSELERDRSVAVKKAKEEENLRLKDEVAHKNRELVSLAINISDKNKALNDVLEYIKSNAESDSINEVRSVIKQNINLEDDWKKLQLHFNKVHPQFFNLLRGMYPKLSTLELKHCAYLKIDLSIKEISRILNISPKSVQMAHYRIKKKMDLETDTTLSSYLHSL